MTSNDPFGEMKLVLRDPMIWLIVTFGVIIMVVGSSWIGAAFIGVATGLYIAFHDKFSSR